MVLQDWMMNLSRAEVAGSTGVNVVGWIGVNGHPGALHDGLDRATRSILMACDALWDVLFLTHTF